jgi:PEP-CTERM motif
MDKAILCSLCLFALLSQAILTLPAEAVTYLSNTGVPNEGGYGIGTSWLAQSFQTGTNSGGYSLNSITLVMGGTIGSPTGFALAVYSNSGGNPNAILEVLAGNNDPQVYDGLYSYISPNLLLQPTSTYWLVTSAITGYYVWSSTHLQNYASTDGWYIDTIGYSWAVYDPARRTWAANPASTYGTMKFVLDATPVPEPGSGALVALGLTCLGCIGWRRSAVARREKQRPRPAL